MSNELSSEIDKVNYYRWLNTAKNTKNDISRAFFVFALTLKEIKDKGYYDFEYDNFRDFCEKELDIDWRTAYDYAKIADFVIDNKKYISTEKAGLLGHKKLKILAQKLGKLEEKERKKILKLIDEKETTKQIEELISEATEK